MCSGEDEIFINMTIIEKGRKLVTRGLPLLFPNQIFAIFFTYMRNLAIFLTNQRTEQEIEGTQPIVNYIVSIVSNGNVSQTILALQTVLAAHSDTALIRILQSRVRTHLHVVVCR